MELAHWLRRNAFATDTIDPAAPLDDLEPLRVLVGDARVVAIGECAHHVREFAVLRHRLLRFLVERCGFGVYALEAPYVGSATVDAWVRGGPGDLRAITRPPSMALLHSGEVHDIFRRLRAHNTTAARPVSFVGTLAGDGGGSPLPELRRVAARLRESDPDALPLLERAVATATRYHDEHPLRALLNHRALDRPTRDALSADLSRLLGRIENTVPRHDDAVLDMRASWLVDHLHRDQAGDGLTVGSTALDTFMAESVLHRLDRRPDARIVLALHNVHLRSTRGGHGVLSAGYQLRRALGSGYVAIAATGHRGTVRCARLNADAPSGHEHVTRTLPAPAPGSIEAAIAAAAPDPAAALTIADLRSAEVRDAVTAIRSEDGFLQVPVLEAFDAVAHLPELRATRPIDNEEIVHA